MGRTKTTGISHNKKSKMYKTTKRNMTLKSNTQCQCSSQSIKTFFRTTSASKEGCSSASQMVWHIHFYALYLILFIIVR